MPAMKSPAMCAHGSSGRASSSGRSLREQCPVRRVPAANDVALGVRLRDRDAASEHAAQLIDSRAIGAACLGSRSSAPQNAITAGELVTDMSLASSPSASSRRRSWHEISTARSPTRARRPRRSARSSPSSRDRSPSRTLWHPARAARPRARDVPPGGRAVGRPPRPRAPSPARRRPAHARGAGHAARARRGRRRRSPDRALRALRAAPRRRARRRLAPYPLTSCGRTPGWALGAHRGFNNSWAIPHRRGEVGRLGSDVCSAHDNSPATASRIARAHRGASAAGSGSGGSGDPEPARVRGWLGALRDGRARAPADRKSRRHRGLRLAPVPGGPGSSPRRGVRVRIAGRDPSRGAPGPSV